MKRGEYLATKRLERGLSEKQLAEKLGASEEDVRRWEAGAFPEAKYLLPLSEILGADPKEILRGCSEEAPGALSSAEEADLPDADPAAETVSENSSPPGEEGHFAPAPPKPAPAAKKQPETYYERLHKKVRYSDDPSHKDYRESRYCDGFSPFERVFGYIACILCVVLSVFGTVWYLVEKHSEENAFSSQIYTSCPYEIAAGEREEEGAKETENRADPAAEAYMRCAL